MTERTAPNRRRNLLLLLAFIALIAIATVVVVSVAFKPSSPDPATVALSDVNDQTDDAPPSQPTREEADAEVVPSVPTGHQIGHRAPDFALPTLEGETLELSSYRGQVVILDFWASWCTPCRVSMPDLYGLWQDHAESGVVFLGVSLDRSEADVSAYVASKSYDGFLPLYGSYAAASNVAKRYGVSGIPRTFVIDREGIVRFAGHPATLSAAKLSGWL